MAKVIRELGESTAANTDIKSGNDDVYCSEDASERQARLCRSREAYEGRHGRGRRLVRAVTAVKVGGDEV